MSSHSLPQSAKFHLINSGLDKYILDVDGGAIRPLSKAQGATIAAALALNDMARAELIALGIGAASAVTEIIPPQKSVPTKAFSLAVAQKCNLGCTYCYADHGSFGGAKSSMTDEVARAAVERLFQDAKPGEKITVAFMGGEPLANRRTLHFATRYAASLAADKNVSVGFTMATNATLIRKEDVELFQEYGFTLSVSIDGLKATNDLQRPYASGRGSFDKVAKNVLAILERPQRTYRVLARVTVTPHNLDLPEIMNGLVDMGFDSIMFSPMLSAPTGIGEMQQDDFDKFLIQLIACGKQFQGELKRGNILPLSNITKTLKRIHWYQKDQYPCGAGGGYMGVSAEGDLYVCHRFVNDETGRMGDVFQGIDQELQSQWLVERNLQKQSPCTSCWARHLCGGSCHYEVVHRGRPACDYIRGWLDYCLKIYASLAKDNPSALKFILNGT